MSRKKLLFTALLTMLCSFAVVQVAHAVFGRADLRGYFDNEYYSSGADNYGAVLNGGIPDSVDTADEFINFMKQKIDGDGSSLSMRNRVGASFIVQTMLGYDGGNGTTKYINSSDSRFTEWANRIRDRASKGRVKWNLVIGHTENSGTQKNRPEYDAATWNGSSLDAASIVFYDDSGSFDASHIVYVLKRDCGNPVGSPVSNDLPGLPDDSSTGCTGNNCGGCTGGDCGGCTGSDCGGCQTDCGNNPDTNLTINVEGIGSVTFSSVTTPNYSPFDGQAHDVGTCGKSIAVSGSRDCPGIRIGPVTVRAPDLGPEYEFRGWSGNCYSINGFDCNVEQQDSGSRTITATYQRDNSPNQPSVSANCSTISVSGISDPDYSGYLTTQIFRDGVLIRTTSASGNTDQDISGYRDFLTHTYRVRVISKSISGRENSGRYTDSDTTAPVGPCASVTCGSISSAPANPEFGLPFTITADFNYDGGPQGTIVQKPAYRMNITATGPGINSNTNNISYSPLYGGNGTSDPVTLTAISPGVVTVVMTLSGPGLSLTCGGSDTGKIIVISKPIFRVYGGDVASGYEVCSGWSSSPSTGKILAFNKGNGSGSGVQLAAFAISAIDGFSSATGRSADPLPPKGLSFSNNGGNATYGGDFSEGGCPYDYYSNVGGQSVGQNIDVAGLGAGTFKSSGSVIVGSSARVSARTTLFVDGDVYIASSISYQTAGWTLDTIPNFTLIVHGNIFIGSDVSNIDGVYVAQPLAAGTKGTILTCSFNNPTPRSATASEISSSCGRKLTINGALLAKSIRLQRTNGSLKDSSNNQPASDANIAESFISGPDVWLGVPAFSGSTNVPKFESFTALPPVL